MAHGDASLNCSTEEAEAGELTGLVLTNLLKEPWNQGLELSS